MEKAIIIYGAPGAGKGTQAELLAKRYNFIHFDTGRFLEALVNSPEARKDKVLKREKASFDSGKLMTTSFVLDVMKKKTEGIWKGGYSVVFSGSPRTITEAFGDKKTEGLLSFLSKTYGKKNITIIQLKTTDKESLKRNSARFVCGVCGLPRLADAGGNKCAFCAGALRRRTLDAPKVILERIKE